jgi:hypothetical protein
MERSSAVDIFECAGRGTFNPVSSKYKARKATQVNWKVRRFPGAVKSPLITSMDFLAPATLPRIPTYRVMSDDGALEDQNRDEPDVTDEQVLTWYKNMLTGQCPRLVGARRKAKD